MPAGKKSSGQQKPSQKKRRAKQGRLGLSLPAYVSDQLAFQKDGLPRLVRLRNPKAVKSEASAEKSLKLPTAVKSETSASDIEDKAVKFECDDIEADDMIDHDDEDEHYMICDHDKLSHNMAKFLRHIAHKEELLDEDGWLPLCDALPRLHCTEAEAAKTVQQSDRHDDVWRLGARFEMYISGSCTWIRATNGAYYRSRYRARRATDRAQRRSQ